jgi:hypothetical protein
MMRQEIATRLDPNGGWAMRPCPAMRKPTQRRPRG